MQVADVPLHGSLGAMHDVGDLLIRQPQRDVTERVELAPAQQVQRAPFVMLKRSTAFP
jgi:hypothetical protein